jgi:hypothetical protein
LERRDKAASQAKEMDCSLNPVFLIKLSQFFSDFPEFFYKKKNLKELFKFSPMHFQSAPLAEFPLNKA